MAVRSLSLETTVVDIDGSLGEHEEEFLVVEKHDQFGVKALGRSQIHDSILKHLSMGRFRLGYAVNHEAMISLLDENVLFHGLGGCAEHARDRVTVVHDDVFNTLCA